MNDSKTLNGKTAIVTGGGSGIGKAITLALAEAGVRVVFSYNKSETSAREVVKQTSSFNVPAIMCKADMENTDDIEKLAHTAIKNYGTIDILVNNAGVAVYHPFLEIPRDVWNRTINVNLTSVFILSQTVARLMVEKATKGSIINISSLGGFSSQKGLAHYNASKGGLNLLTKTMALELGPYGVRVNAIAPGAIEVDRNRASLVDGAYVNEWKRIIPIGRWGQPDDIANIVLFLASDISNFITGHILCADGGQMVQVPQPVYDYKKWEK
jgi:NAD(P)-dependent dehydrogenase (short-subunit alcohol dehydrogenase family)